jgi:hypothetical protein
MSDTGLIIACLILGAVPFVAGVLLLFWTQ